VKGFFGVGLVAVLSLGAWVFGCDSGTEKLCTPGQRNTCPCLGGSEGIQDCLPDGSGWEECQCCQPSCAGKNCGSDGCGGSCGTCTSPDTCSALGACECVAACNGLECGNDPVCGTTCGECTDPETCQADGTCACIPVCGTQECGVDAVCGTSCGECTAPATCNAQFLCECVQDCTGLECGLDPVCNVACGTCTLPEVCNAQGQCECTPACTGYNCGPDGCGGTCECTGCGIPMPDLCMGDGQCREACCPNCAGRECGLDLVCGYPCGACSDPTPDCTSEGHCIDDPCIPNPCNSHGTCVSNGPDASCTCDPPFGGAWCNQCAVEAFGVYPDCFVPPSDFCDFNQCWPVPPTRQETCFDEMSETACPGNAGDGACATTAYCGQDAQYPDSEQRFTCYNPDGTIQDPCDATANSNEVVTDSLTGLMWQRTWVEGQTWAQAQAYCANLDYAGHDDWLLPNPHEHQSIIHDGVLGPTLDGLAFPGAQALDFWTSAPNLGFPDFSWYMDLADGRTDGGGAWDSPMAVRCVRLRRAGGAAQAGLRFAQTEPVLGQQVVTDAVTGLVWQHERTAGLTWQQALAYCEGLDHGGFTDWRLPNKKELASLVNYGIWAEASDFPDVGPGWFWTSTTHLSTTTYAWYARFYYGEISGTAKDDTSGYLRCVRPSPFGCVSDCAGRDCGSDGCGGSCGSCTDGEYCNITGQCESRDYSNLVFTLAVRTSDASGAASQCLEGLNPLVNAGPTLADSVAVSGFTLSGQVRASGSPLTGARVSVLHVRPDCVPPSVTTDGSGYSFYLPPGGPYDLQAVATDGRVGYARVASLQGNATQSIDLPATLALAGGPIYEVGVPAVNGWTVQAWYRTGANAGRLAHAGVVNGPPSFADGEFSLPLEAGPAYDLLGVPPTGSPFPLQLLYEDVCHQGQACGSTNPGSSRLKDGFSLLGQITTTAGASAAGSLLELVKSTDSRLALAATAAADGNYSVLLRPGQWLLTALPSDLDFQQGALLYAVPSQSIVNSDVVKNISLGQGEMLNFRGRLVDSGGVGVAGIQVKLILVEQPMAEGSYSVCDQIWATTQADGSFEVRCNIALP